MISCNSLPDNCEIVIIRKIGCHRIHFKYGRCGKTKINEQWEGNCSRCDYIEKNILHLPAVIMPMELHYFDILFKGEQTKVSTNRTLAQIIGNEIGPFHFIRKYKGKFACYKESKFLS